MLRFFYNGLSIPGLLLVAVCLPSCKDAAVFKKASGPDAEKTAPLPARVESATAPKPASGLFDLDEQSGRPRSNLVLRLDYFPTPEPGKTTLPACYTEFPADFEVGEVECLESTRTDGTKSVPVLAKHLVQSCYTIPDRSRVSPSEPFVFTGCSRARVVTYAYNPQVRVDVEIR